MFTKTETYDKCSAIASAELNVNDSNSTDLQDQAANNSNSSLLHSIDEHYICDIAMMSIAEEVGQMTAQALLSSADQPLVSTISNGNELEIDRQEEEQAISQLVRSSNGGALMEPGSHNSGSMRVVLGILVRLVLPLANGVARGIKGIRDVRVLQVLQNLASSRQALTNLVAFAANTISLNLSSVQAFYIKCLSLYPQSLSLPVSNRLGPLLNLLKLRKSQDGLESLPDTLSTHTPTTPITSTPPNTPTTPSPPLQGPPTYSLQSSSASCCTLNILAAPPAGTPIRADIVLVHGLHGSLLNTWRQGLWQNERHPVEFDRPPRPPVRPPKRPRHSRSAAIHPAPREKRAKFASCNRLLDTEATFDDAAWQQATLQQTTEPKAFSASDNDDDAEDYAYVCGDPEDIQICEGIEYSFPTFRLRMHDNSHLLQVELESMLQAEGNNSPNMDTAQASAPRKTASKSKKKPSANDPNYSNCWPGDWLPLDCPGVRVIAVNYTTDQYLWRPLWKTKEPRSSLIQRSREMAELLMQHRVGHGHPIIYVGHSKGGLFIKQLIVDAWESGRPAMRPLWRSARGCFFYSVPHRGSHLASIKAPLLTRSVELLEIEKNNKYLLDLHRRFAGLYHLGHLKIEVFSFVETALTLMSVLYLRIVGVDSADPGFGEVCGIRLDHREICKPRSRECILYKELVKMIRKVC
ncbi:uncharacterized protein [Drosophila virilis]|uniref:Uncharacterized protein, isoform B n=1 Tax=Drosophila virilis TaxID=7244 RepID=A0A0Q9WGU7_DROVI|nr:uncharacterized protein LOC6630903 isoform X1 [Drosophila virilis]XP_015027712.1 uncharacterized protein LOC6630903 isoform X1 [Drosophila virilis]XP_015027713.1 uncharacterized protein LOC6630903 isoform X1 [Drosophila virilis]XP_015027716.1 uncharacterized protein LOC6630903 isoform X1 [Drosophila virilis]XP_032294943.1 uncharacterized protein LOC6630903 isoform X1 [Drosophila virilis]KRF83608.1 uncharacterized protein Dvir_GJ24488, isoform B [Drosophila virilis]KRF83609.1 uncharacterize